MQALLALLDLSLPARDLALLCQKVENLIVGAPCGVMDQMTAAAGVQGGLLALLCQPAELQPAVQLPEALEVWGLDSGIRHAISGADYGSVRVGAFMGYRIVAALAGLTALPMGESRVSINDPRWQGYLANVTPSDWEARFRDRVPETLTGAEFLARYGGFTDAVTRIDPARTYAVRQPAAHPIYEHHRVSLFRALLQKPRLAENDFLLLGELMYQSHLSYSACGLGSAGTDQLVDMVRALGPDHGLYGAKITGGGSGGTVAVLARRGSAETVAALAREYAAHTGRAAHLLGGSSPGVLQFGVNWLVSEPASM
jgi:L-arabinokinase